MSNVTNPPGPLNPTNPQRSTEPTKPGTDKFKNLMRIDKSNEEQKKRKKRQEEAEEETKAEIQTTAVSAERAAETKRKEKFPKVQKIGESEKKQTKHQKRPEEISLEAENENIVPSAPKVAQSLELPTPEEAKTAVPTARHQTPSQIQEEEEQQIIQQEEKISQEFKLQPEEKKPHEKKEERLPSILPTASELGPLFLAPAAEMPPAYTLLSAETLALFERMVSVMSILHDSGITETVIHLNTPEFAHSFLAGSQIVIREYSTAPLTYNIELVGNPQAVALFTKNLPLLKSAFQEGKHRFRVNRLESTLSRDETPKVKRKEDLSEET